MAEPSRRTSRLTLAGGSLAAIALVAAGFALGRGSRPDPVPPLPKAAPAPAEPVLSSLPTVQPSLDRAELLRAAADAADAFAAGRPLPDSVAALSGREFKLRLPYGCAGDASGEDAALSWRYDPETGAIRIRAEPVLWPTDLWSPAGAEGNTAEPEVEAIQGFWISRPWTSAENCPPAALPQGPAQPAEAEAQAPTAEPEEPGPAEPETVGIAQFFTSQSSRIGRRDGKSFEAVERLEEETFGPEQRLRLRLSGRIGSNAPAVLCRATGARRPVCLIRAELDEVAVENSATGETITRWDVASQTRQGGGNR